jgi:CubicO group peptidase (beta-lactamase class C family)
MTLHLTLPTTLLLATPILAGPWQDDALQRHREEQIAPYLTPYLETGNFSGSILVAMGGEVLFSKAYGMADMESGVPNEPGTSYYLASTSRIFTSAAILLLEQQGKLSVDDPLSKYLPDWPRGDEIKIHHLLTLSAGFPNINELLGYSRWSQEPQTPRSLCEKFRDLPLEFDPGTRPVHSNSNYNVLALLIEEISQLSYGAFLEREFFAPLGMTSTAHDADSAIVVENRARGYRPVGLAEVQPHPGPHWSVKTGNGSIYSTTEDLYRFDRMLVEKSILGEAAVAKLFTEHFPGHGYGWFANEKDGETVLSVGGRSPGFGSSWQRSVNADLTVIVLGNLYNGVPTTLATTLRRLALRQEVPLPPMRAEAPDPAIVAEAVGSYRFGPDFYRANATVTLHERDGHLFDGDSWLIPAGERTFLHRTYWSTLTFEEVEAGRAKRLTYDDFVGTRIR